MSQKGISLFLLVILSFAVSRCGRRISKTTQQSPGTKYTLFLFGAPWCHNCHREYHILKDLIEQDVGSTDSRLKVRVYVTEGKDAGSAPNQEALDFYKNELNAPYEFVIDPPIWKTYRKWIKKNPPFKIPAAALMDETGEVRLELYPPADTFTGQSVAASVHSYLQK